MNENWFGFIEETLENFEFECLPKYRVHFLNQQREHREMYLKTFLEGKFKIQN